MLNGDIMTKDDTSNDKIKKIPIKPLPHKNESEHIEIMKYSKEIKASDKKTKKK